MGLRSATEISASISQMFASKFNDDKKTLAFSDNVQEAAHRAGFFNSRTWRFGLRTAIQKYCFEAGAGLSLADFQNGFIKYWHDHMTQEQFVRFFIAPNMTWKNAYEDMVKNRKLGTDNCVSFHVFHLQIAYVDETQQNGMMVYTVATYLFSREYTEKTLKIILPIPV